ncbi:Ubiquitin-conjugating enzyme E2 2 [Linum perenne]
MRKGSSYCLDILQSQWSPIYDVAAILTTIQNLNGIVKRGQYVPIMTTGPTVATGTTGSIWGKFEGYNDK